MRKMILLCAFFLITTKVQGTPRTDDVRRSEIDVHPELFKNYVPFGQIYKEGFWDPNGQIKQPIDILELQMNKFNKKDGANKHNVNGKTYSTKLEKPGVFLNPRDSYIADHILKVDENINMNITRPLWLDLTAIFNRNAISPTTPRRLFPKRNETQKEKRPTQPELNKREYFSAGSYDLISWRQKQAVNWSSCKEFANGGTFHPKDVIDIEWVPFYIWSNRRKTFCDVHRFSYPTVKLVKHFRETYGSKLTKTVDWNQPTLFMNGTGEWLLIAVDRTGLFHAIPRHNVPEFVKTKPIKFPVATMRFKIFDPYLAYMICDEPYAAVMAVSGTEPPNDKDKELEASGIGFKGVGAPISRDIEFENKMKRIQVKNANERERNKYVEIVYK